mgnify:CR=1 FL=1
MKIENVKAVITGAGSGLGEGTARYLKDKGAEVLLIDLNGDGLKKVADEINCKFNRMDDRHVWEYRGPELCRVHTEANTAVFLPVPL